MLGLSLFRRCCGRYAGSAGIPLLPRDPQWIQKRHILAMMAALCIMMLFILKVNFSIAIVAMVKPSAHIQPNYTDMDTPFEKDGREEEEGEFSWDMITQGNILAAYFYGFIATQLPGGYAANRWGGKIVAGPGIALTGLVTLLSPFAARQGGPWALFAVRLIEGLCSGVVIPGVQQLFSQWFPPHERSSFSGAVFSAMYCGTVIGMAASGPLSKWPLNGGGWPMVFYFYGAIGMALIIPWYFLVYDSPERHPHISEDEKSYILAGLYKENQAINTQKTAQIPWLSILTDIHVWAAVIFQWGSGWVLYTMLSDIPIYMKNVLHFDIEKVAYLSALPSLLTWISSIIYGILSQWLRRRNYISHLTAYRIFNGIAALGPTAFLIAIPQVGCNPNAIVVFLLLSGMTTGAHFGGSYLNHLDLAINYAGILSGFVHTVVNTSGIIVPMVVAGFVQEKQTLENWANIFYTVAGISTITCILYFLFGSVKERPWNNQGGSNKET